MLGRLLPVRCESSILCKQNLNSEVLLDCHLVRHHAHREDALTADTDMAEGNRVVDP